MLLNGLENSRKLPIPIGGHATYLIYGSLGPPAYSSTTACRLVQPFLHSSPWIVPLFYNAALRSPEIASPPWGIGSPSNTWYLRHTRVIIPNSMSNCRSVQPFLYGSQMLWCTMHCQWGRKPPKLPLTLGISSPCRRMTEPQP